MNDVAPSNVLNPETVLKTMKQNGVTQSVWPQRT